METVEVEKTPGTAKDAAQSAEQAEMDARAELEIYKKSLNVLAEERDSLRESVDYWRKQSSAWESDNDQLRREVKTLRALQSEADAAAAETFQMLLGQAREAANRAQGLLMRARAKNPNAAKKMAKDLLEFGDFVRRIAEDGAEGGEPG